MRTPILAPTDVQIGLGGERLDARVEEVAFGGQEIASAEAIVSWFDREIARGDEEIASDDESR